MKGWLAGRKKECREQHDRRHGAKNRSMRQKKQEQEIIGSSTELVQEKDRNASREFCLLYFVCFEFCLIDS